MSKRGMTEKRTSEREIVLARAAPNNIGLSSVGGCLYPESLDEEHGVYVKVGPGHQEVLAPIAPGLISPVSIERCHLLELAEGVEVTHKPSVLALDGEREIEVGRDDQIYARLTGNGPRVVNIR